jgi:hypothetical protein
VNLPPLGIILIQVKEVTIEVTVKDGKPRNSNRMLGFGSDLFSSLRALYQLLCGHHVRPSVRPSFSPRPIKSVSIFGIIVLKFRIL